MSFQANASPVFAAMTPPAEPFSDREFSALMQPFAPFPQRAAFALAVSGGPDSMALAWCMKHWAAAQGYKVMALIVDHGLRPESRMEAKETLARLVRLDMAAEILIWEHPPLNSKIHSLARKARYRLLAEACQRHGIKHLLTAHQREDQGETILMRLAKGSGIDGLAGISAQSVKDGLTLLRPFLTTPKDRLIATCRAAQLGFSDDPSNRSEKYARGRLRRVLPLLASEGLTMDRLADLGRRAADARDALDHYTKALLRVASRRDATGAIFLNLEHLRAAPPAIADRALIACLQDIHREDYPPEYDAVTRLRAFLLSADIMTPRTLHGCLIARTAAHAVIVREAATIVASALIRPGESVLWDQRWRVTLAPQGAMMPLAVRALGNPPHEILDRLAPNLRRYVPQGRIRATLPALWQGEQLVLIPSFEGFQAPGTARAERMDSELYA